MYKRCPNTMLGEYINHYAKCKASWKRFWSIVSIDFDPSFLKENEASIRNAYEYKRDIQDAWGVKHVLL